MFICKDCVKDYIVDRALELCPTSYGPCEDCHKTTVCYDLPHNSYYHKDSEYAKRLKVK